MTWLKITITGWRPPKCLYNESFELSSAQGRGSISPKSSKSCSTGRLPPMPTAKHHEFLKNKKGTPVHPILIGLSKATNWVINIVLPCYSHGSLLKHTRCHKRHWNFTKEYHENLISNKGTLPIFLVWRYIYIYTLKRTHDLHALSGNLT